MGKLLQHTWEFSEYVQAFKDELAHRYYLLINFLYAKILKKGDGYG